ncbi:GNAT family N-acetyltransferase [Rubrivivax gelatinosus]|uniref:GNAT family N-acetyltransferase n=1 Tax=Rubrivivax gelatinosus TaxID=28068 RepID=UPI0002D98887|nr:GNAT family N-acetyltransferase [Rubrivivax gelatinosus]MBG6080395.1 CelD/BcsL family acetyltransferase involved in cellulose biosynthesis [Rubrivivax gelatinosus]
MPQLEALTWTRAPARTALADADRAADWNRLNARRGGHTILDAAAVRCALDVFGDGRECLLVGRDGAGVAAMLVVCRVAPLQWRTFQPSQLPLGTWVAREDVELDALSAAALRALPGAVVLSITQVDPLLHARPADSATLRTADYIDTAWVPLEGSFDDYWAARGKNLRQNVRKQRKKLADEGVQVELREIRAPEAMAAAIERYGLLESTGWKQSTGTAIHAGNDQGRFYTRWFEEAARAGEALICEYHFDGRPVAMNLGLLRSGTLIVLKTAYDESFKAVSPSTLLREEEFKLFFAGTEVRRIEYFGKVMEWHTRLTEHRRTLYHVTRFRWPWLRALAERRRAAPQAAAGTSPETAPDA